MTDPGAGGRERRLTNAELDKLERLFAAIPRDAMVQVEIAHAVWAFPYLLAEVKDVRQAPAAPVGSPWEPDSDLLAKWCEEWTPTYGLPLGEYLANRILDDIEYRAPVGSGAAEPEPLKAFARQVLRDALNGAGFDGGDLQELAVQLGLLVPTKMEAPCDPDACVCAEVTDFPTTCYRFSPLISERAAPPAGLGEEKR